MSIDHVKRTTDKPMRPNGSDPTTWVYLADLTLPPEVQQRVERECRELRLPRECLGWRLEGEKLCHFFRLKAVAYKLTPRGLLVLMSADSSNSPEFVAFLDALSPDERSCVQIDYLFDPNDGVLRIS